MIATAFTTAEHGSFNRIRQLAPTRSGVETVNRGTELLGTPESGAKKFFARKDYATYEVIYLAENTKSIKTLGVGGLHRFPDPVADTRAPKPHLRFQHFGLPLLALGGRPRELRAPRLVLNQGPSEPTGPISK